MINWILGSMIVVITLFIIIKQVKDMKKGKRGCSCSNSSNCSFSSDCPSKKK